MWEYVVNNNTENTQSCVVIDSNVCVVICQSKSEPKYTKEQSCDNKDKHLSFHIYDFSIVFVILVFSLLVEIVEFQSKPIDSSAHCNLVSSHVDIQLDVDLVQNVFEYICFRTLHHVSVDQLKSILDGCLIDLMKKRWKLLN